MEGARQLVQEIALYLGAAGGLGLVSGWLAGRRTGARRATRRARAELRGELYAEVRAELAAASAPNGGRAPAAASPVLVRPDPALFAENERLRDRLVVVNARAKELAEDNETLRADLRAVEQRVATVEARLGIELPAAEAPPGPPASSGAVVDSPTTPADDLTRLTGVGEREAAKLAAAGLRTFGDVARLGDADLERLATELDLPARRLRRWDWPSEAKRLAPKA